jgi:hypothetical protein
MSDDNTADYFHGSVSTDGQEIVFISALNDGGNQIFLGSINDPSTKEFKSESKSMFSKHPFLARPFLPVPSASQHFNETQNVCYMAHDEASIRPKLRQVIDKIFLIPNCLVLTANG